MKADLGRAAQLLLSDIKMKEGGMTSKLVNVFSSIGEQKVSGIMLYYFSEQRRLQKAFHSISLKTKFLAEILINLSPE